MTNETNKWIDHFQSMADGNFEKSNILLINQRGRGLGTNKKGTILYKLKQTGSGSDPNIISPLVQNVDQAKSKINFKKRRRSKSKSRSRSRSSSSIKGRSKSSKRRKRSKIRKRRSSSKRKKRSHKRTKSSSSSKRKKITKKRIADLFGI
jgi:hypothetical protein